MATTTTTMSKNNNKCKIKLLLVLLMLTFILYQDKEHSNRENDHGWNSLLQSWTQDYIDAMDLAGGMTRILVVVQLHLSDDYVHTTPEIGPLGRNDYI